MKLKQECLSLIARLNSVIEHLRAAKSPADYRRASFLEAVQELEEIARDKRFNALASDFLGIASFEPIAKETRRIYELFEEFCETNLALEVIAGKAQMGSPQILRTFDFAKREGKSAGLNENSRVLFIGSGPFPESALAYAKAFGCKVTCVDIRPEAVVLGGAVVAKFGLKEKISLVQGDASNFDYAGFTHVVVAVLARPKEQIFEQILRKCDCGAIVVCRTVRGLRSLIYEPAQGLPLDKWMVSEAVIGSDETIVHSVILEKTGQESMQVCGAVDCVADCR